MEQIFLICLAFILLIAAICDIRSYIIPNSLSIALILLFILRVVFIATPLLAIGVDILTAGVIFLLGLFLFSRSMFGGGDVKLLAALTLCVGLLGAPRLLLVMSLVGGLLALLILAIRRLHWAQQAHLDRRIPYGVAIAAAGFDYCLQQSHLIAW